MVDGVRGGDRGHKFDCLLSRSSAGTKQLYSRQILDHQLVISGGDSSLQEAI